MRISDWSSDVCSSDLAAWICLGIAMRLTLYDAAFASLVRVGGHHARRPIAQITLLGGLASTVFWPLGHALVHYFDWRGALWEIGRAHAELQSLMRISYAVFCLKKKNTQKCEHQ